MVFQRLQQPRLGSFSDESLDLLRALSARHKNGALKRRPHLRPEIDLSVPRNSVDSHQFSALSRRDLHIRTLFVLH